MIKTSKSKNLRKKLRHLRHFWTLEELAHHFLQGGGFAL